MIIRLPKKYIFLFVIIVLIFILIKVFSSYYSVFNYYNEPIYKGDPNSKKIAFACNVYWGNEYIPDLLNIFKEEDIKITFFIGGSWARSFPRLLKIIHDEGHEIGNHGYSHKNHANLTLEENKAEILKAEKQIEEIIGIKTELFAPPSGAFNDDTIKAAEELNYKIILWSIDTIDWKKPGSQYIRDKVLGKTHNGAIVLMHPVKDTVEALPSIIAELKEQGYKVTNIHEIIYSSNHL